MHFDNKPRARRLKRLALLILAACFVFSSLANLGISAESRVGKDFEEKSEDYRKWAQGDSRWGSLPMGTSGKTVARIGCLVTSVTKLIIQSGLRNSSSFNVATLVNWLNAHGGISSAGNLVWAKPAQMIDGLEFYGMDFTTGSSSSSSMQNRIMNYVRGGYRIVLFVKNQSHWVAVDNTKSLATGQVYIMDSLNNVSGNADVALTSRYSYVYRICLYTGGSPDAPNPTPTPNPTQPPAPTPAPDYVDQCDYETVSVQARVTAQSATLYSQPCTSGNGSSATGTAPSGSILDVSAQVVNTAGENWYQVEREGGQRSFINLQSVEFAGFVNDLQIVPFQPPTGSLPIGSGYPLNETVISRHRITKVTGRFTDSDGDVIKSVTLEPNTRGTFSISSSQINSQLRFGELAAGHYNYELIAEITADSNMTNQTKVFRAVFVSPFSIGTSALETHTVSFVDPIAGETVATQTVAHGFYPVLIDAPEHEGMTFSHWNGAGQRVYSNVQLTAVYTSGVNTPGDADGNGTVNVVDALVILRYAIGTSNSGILLDAADVNGDGIVNLSDAIRVLRSAIM